MLDIVPFAGKAAGIISLVAFIPYIITTIKGKTRPNKASWWIWTLIGALIAGSYHAVGATETIYVAVSYSIGPFIIAVLSLKYGIRGWSRLDSICMAGALAGISIWVLFDAPLIALLMNIVVDGFAFIPTIKKAYLKPGEEDKLSWVLFGIASILNLFAIEEWTIGMASYPVYLFILEVTVVSLLFIPRSNQADSSSNPRISR